MFREIFLAFCGFSFGMLASAGVFTVFSAVALVPRFAGKSHSAKEIFVYEDMIILGTIVGSTITLWPEIIEKGVLRLEELIASEVFWNGFRFLSQACFGLFSGMFVGCLALAIAEMLDSIPIFTRRVSFRKGIGFAILFVALGKLVGSLFYFLHELQA